MPAFKLKKDQPVPSVADFAVGGAIMGKGASALRGLMRVAKPQTEGILERMVRETAEGPMPSWTPPKVQPVNRWATGHSPKPGGVLDRVLSAAGEKQGMGEAVTPGESSLLEQFSQLLGNRRR